MLILLRKLAPYLFVLVGFISIILFSYNYGRNVEKRKNELRDYIQNNKKQEVIIKEVEKIVYIKKKQQQLIKNEKDNSDINHRIKFLHTIAEQRNNYKK